MLVGGACLFMPSTVNLCPCRNPNCFKHHTAVATNVLSSVSLLQVTRNAADTTQSEREPEARAGGVLVRLT